MSEETREIEVIEETPVVEASPSNSEEIQAAISAERKRTAEIRRTVRAANLDASVATKLEEDGTTVDEARKFVLDTLASKQSEVPHKDTNQSHFR